MSESLIMLVTYQHYNNNQANAFWQLKCRIFKDEITIGILGLSELGLYVAKSLHDYGFKAIGWKNSSTSQGDIPFYHGKTQLTEFLQQCQIIICLLPLAVDTKHILNKETFALLPQGAYVINLAHDGHLNEDDLRNYTACCSADKPHNSKHTSG